jgi:integrase
VPGCSDREPERRKSPCIEDCCANPQIALLVTDCDLSQGRIKVTKARVVSRDKDRTKTREDRIVELCPRALHVLKRRLALRARLQLAGKIRHEELFLQGRGSPIRNLQYPGLGGGARSRSLSKADIATRTTLVTPA